MDEIEFEWDSHKARSNVRKHGVTFAEAATVFGDHFGQVALANHVGSEMRSEIIGLSAMGRLLVVVFVDRGRIRIISARRATPFERHAHEETVR